MPHNAAVTDGDPTTPQAPGILVVDDDDKLTSVIVRALERAGYRCRTAATGDQTLWAVNGGRPDALVLDVMIPHPSGVEVCRHLRADGYDGPILMVSARSSVEDRAAATRAGADRFFAKPFKLSDLVETLGEMLADRTS